MKAREARPSFLVPIFVGRTESDLTAREQAEQLDLFREALTRQAKLQILAMLGLSNPKRLDQTQAAKIADIAGAMGYEREVRKDGYSAFPSAVYHQIEDTGQRLRRKSIPVFVREPDGRTRDGRRKWKEGMVDLSILQEFGFYYENEDGQPIDLARMPKDQLIKYEVESGAPLYALPMKDDKGNFILNPDGSKRRKMADGVLWAWASRFARYAQNTKTAWVFYLDALEILRRYLTKPASFDLIWMTLFYKDIEDIESGHAKLVQHLNIRSKDKDQVQAAIDAAFADALKEGIIDKPVTVRLPGYYQPTGKTGRARRKDKVYRWQRAARWKLGKDLIELTPAAPKALKDGKTESRNA